MISLLIFIAILVALIWVHELGHFSVAKLFGIRVDEFAIGFPPRVLSVRYGETEYSFNVLLVGGYVKIYGENAGEEDHPRSLARKNRGVQAAVMLAGVGFNVLFAWLLLSAGFMAGLPSAAGANHFGEVRDARATIIGVLPGSPAALAGLLSNDTVVFAETGRASLPTGSSAQALQEFISAHPEETVLLHVERPSTSLGTGAGEGLTFAVRPAEGVVEGRKAVGVNLGDVGTLQLPPHLALAEGAVLSYELVVATAQGLGSLIAGALQGTGDLSQVAGPIGIAGVGAGAVQSGAAATLWLTALISINLAIVNLLPIPGLDGGRLLIIAIESVVRRPVPPHIATRLTLAGFAFILVIFILVSINDISRLVG